MRRNGFWIALFAFVLVICIAAAVFLHLAAPKGTMADIYLDSEVILSINLAEEPALREIILENAPCNNVIQVERGRIRVISATCPDQICVHQGWISSATAPIVCLPGKLMIKIRASAEETAPLDGVSK